MNNILLRAAGADFLYNVSHGYFDDSGFPSGQGWEEIRFPEINDEHAYALEISGD